MKYHCGHCDFKGHCYGNGYSAPWCYQCEMNDKLTPIEEDNDTK